MRWFGEWTGARDPYRGNDQGAMTPGVRLRGTADQADDRYIGFLDAIFHPGRLGPPPKSLAASRNRQPSRSCSRRQKAGERHPRVKVLRSASTRCVSVPADAEQQRQTTQTDEQ